MYKRQAPPPASVPATQKDAVSGRALSIVPRGDSAVALPGPGRSYRGTLHASAGGGGLTVTNEIDVEQYVRGLGEMPASWPAAALQAQAIAARTYAIRAAAAGRILCDDQQCQVYIGSGNEHPATSAAASATKGQVLLYKGALAEAVYSASAGGLSATAEEGFGPGSPDLPYLTPVAYQVDDPQLWAMTVPMRQAAARFGYRGELRHVAVSRTGPSGRPLEITFDGDNGPMPIDAHRFWATLQLRSTMFTLRTEIAEPPPEGEPFAVSLSGPDGGATGSARTGSRVMTAAAVTDQLGRTPWVGLAVVLMALSGSAAHRARGRHPIAPAPAGDGGGDGP